MGHNKVGNILWEKQWQVKCSLKKRQCLRARAVYSDKIGTRDNFHDTLLSMTALANTFWSCKIYRSFLFLFYVSSKAKHCCHTAYLFNSLPINKYWCKLSSCTKTFLDISWLFSITHIIVNLKGNSANEKCCKNIFKIQKRNDTKVLTKSTEFSERWRSDVLKIEASSWIKDQLTS